MREIDGIDKALDTLRPHWGDITTHFERENERFKEFLKAEHEPIGRVLKAHLIVEHYLNRYLVEKMGLETINEARLSFAQKAHLLPERGSAAAFVRPGIIRLNRIRNDFSHNLNADIERHDLAPINDVLNVSGRGPDFRDAVERIEVFMIIVATWLVVPPVGLEHIFAEAFADIRVSDL